MLWRKKVVLDYPLGKLLEESSNAPDETMIIAISYLFDKLSELSEKLDELIDATRGNI
jgi:hypothetical protein